MRITTKFVAVLFAALCTLASADSAFARGRYLHPTLGRYLTRDPFGDPYISDRSAGISPSTHGFLPRELASNVPDSRPVNPTWKYQDGMSLYQYVRSNPLTFVDPSGLACRCGPDVTDAVDKLLADVDAKFDALNAQQQKSLCDGYINAASWDTDFFTNPTIFKTKKCPQGWRCQFDNKVPGAKGGASVTFKGKCYASYDVNYVLYGRLTKKCGNLGSANFWYDVYKFPWPWSSGTWQRYEQSTLFRAYGAEGTGWTPLGDDSGPDNLSKCQPCPTKWDKPIGWYAYGTNGVSISGGKGK